MKFVPYWLDTAPPFTAGREGPPPARADVVVVGGGLNAVSAALALARRGADTVLVESMGHNGHGVQMSTYMGQRMAEVMAGRPEANVWEGLDRPTIPGDFALGWGLPLVGAYYRLQGIQC